MGQVVFDSNVFIYFLSPNSPFHEQAKASLQAVSDGNGLFSSLVFVEVLTSLQGYDLEQARNSLQAFSKTMEVAALDAPIATLAAELRTQWGKKLLLADAVHLATAISKNASSLVTNDADFSKIARTYVTVKHL